MQLARSYKTFTCEGKKTLLVSPQAFLDALTQVSHPEIVYAHEVAHSLQHRYVFPFEGLLFVTAAKEKLELPKNNTLISALRIYVPSV